MTKLVALLASAGILLTACATPEITLEPTFRIGDVRTYALRIVGTVSSQVQGNDLREDTLLEGRWTVEVLAVEGDGAQLRLTLEPTLVERNGAKEERGSQQVELLVGPDGTPRAIETIDGIPATVADDIQELAPLLGAPLPAGRVRLGERWRRTIASGPPIGGRPAQPAEQTGRVAGLRSVHGLDAAMLIVGTRRPLTIQRPLGDQTVQLSGTEFSSSEIAFAFRDGFPVRSVTKAEGRFRVSGFQAAQSDVLITTQRTLDLIPTA